MSYIWSNKNEGDDTIEKVLKKAKSANPNTPIIQEIKYDMNPEYDKNGKLIKGYEGYIVWFDRTKG